MPGPRKEPTALKIAKGTLQKDTVLENEMEFEVLDYIPEPPTDFNEPMVKLWYGCCESLKSIGLLFAQDIPLLIQYVFCVYMVEMSRKELIGMGRDVVKLRSSKREDEFEDKTKWTIVNLDYSKEATRLGQEFGFSPSARTKIAITGSKKSTDPFEKFG